MMSDVLLFSLFLAVLFILAWPLGKYMANVFTQGKTVVDPIFKPIENIIYQFAGVNEKEEMHWRQYATSLVWFNLLGMALVFLIQEIQQLLPFNPEDLAGVAPWHLALNTAVSFMTNTNWQAYGGESTMSYFTQIAALAVQNFLSAATGMAVAVALIRGLTRKTAKTIGNFWVDLVRSTIWVLLPLSILFA